MNERLKTLCQNAFQEVHESRVGIDGLIRTDGNPYIFYEKLAELIVKECLDIAKRTRNNFGSANPDVLEGGRGGAFCVYHNIKNTFGVEE
jgi:hypothetical protein